MRYNRQENLPEIGKKGQEALKNKTVAIIGIGGLGSTVSILLTRMGIGKLIVIDHDKVSLSDLHRQLLYNENDIDFAKANIINKKLTEINHNVKIESHIGKIENNFKILEHADLIIDCLDNLNSRNRLNKYCKDNNKIWIHGSAHGFIGNILVVDEKTNPNIILEKEALRNDRIFPGTVAIIASMQVIQATKILLDKEYEKDLVRINTWNNEIIKIKIK